MRFEHGLNAIAKALIAFLHTAQGLRLGLGVGQVALRLGLLSRRLIQSLAQSLQLLVKLSHGFIHQLLLMTIGSLSFQQLIVLALAALLRCLSLLDTFFQRFALAHTQLLSLL